MVFLNKKRNGFMKRNVVIVSQQSSSMRNIKKNKTRWRFSTATFFFVKLRWEKKKMLFFLLNGFAFSSVWSKSTFAIST